MLITIARQVSTVKLDLHINILTQRILRVTTDRVLPETFAQQVPHSLHLVQLVNSQTKCKQQVLATAWTVLPDSSAPQQD